MFSLFVLAFLQQQTQSRPEQTSALLKDKAGNIVYFFISLLSTKPNNAKVHLSVFSDFPSLFFFFCL